MLNLCIKLNFSNYTSNLLDWLKGYRLGPFMYQANIYKLDNQFTDEEIGQKKRITETK